MEKAAQILPGFLLLKFLLLTYHHSHFLAATWLFFELDSFLLQKLPQNGINGNALSRITSFLSRRTQQLTFKAHHHLVDA